MSNVRISDLPPVGVLPGTALFEISNAGTSQSATAENIRTLFNTWNANQDANGFALEDPLFADDADNTKQLDLSLSGNTTGITLTLATNQSTNQTLNVPNITSTDTIVVAALAQTLTNKTIDAANNTLSNIDETMQTVAVGPAGQVLTSNGVGMAPTYQALPASGITSINGDTAAAQTLTGGTGIDITDVTPDHTIAIDATVVTLTGAQTLTNKTIAAANNTLTIASTDLTDTANIVLNNQANVYTAGEKQEVGHDATDAGFRITPAAGDPSTLEDGDIWINNSSNQIFARINGASVDLGVQAAEVFTWSANHDANGFALEDAKFADPTDNTKIVIWDLDGMATTADLTIAFAQSSDQTLTVPDITAADSLVTNNVAATLLSKTLGTGTTFSAVPTINDGIRFTFNPDNTESGINVGANGTDPTNALDGDIYYQTGVGFRVRDNSTWITLGQPDTPWTVDHNIARFDLDNTGVIYFSTSGPLVDPIDDSLPYLWFDPDLTPDALRINVGSGEEVAIHVNGTQEYSFSSSIFDMQGNILQNASSIEVEGIGTQGILDLGRNSASATQLVADLRFTGGSDEYANIEVVSTVTTNTNERGEMSLWVIAGGTAAEMITLSGGTSPTNSTISFNNRPMGSQINMNNNRIDNVFEILSNDSQEATDGFIRMGDDEYIAWRNNADTQDNGITFNAAGQFEFSIGNLTAADYTFSTTVFDLINKAIETVTQIQDASQNEQIIFGSVGSAVNEFTITNAATGNGPILEATGNDTNIDLNLTAKGTGEINLNNDAVAMGDLVVSDRFQGNKGADVASGDAITLGDGNYFDITGDTTINHMLMTDWQVGSVVTLQFDAANCTVTDNAGGATGDEQDFVLNGGVDFVSAAGDTLTLVNDGSTWREIARSVNS